jgi:hypothetical protein
MVVTVQAPVNYSATILTLVTHVSIALAAIHIDFPSSTAKTGRLIDESLYGLGSTSFGSQWATFVVFKAGLKFGSKLGNRRGHRS